VAAPLLPASLYLISRVLSPPTKSFCGANHNLAAATLSTRANEDAANSEFPFAYLQLQQTRK